MPISKTDSRNGKRLSWEYDAVGNIIRKTNYEGEVTTYTYDSSDRLVAMSNPDYLSASYHYDPAGRLLDRILSNGTRTTFEYDPDNRVVQMQEHNVAGDLIRSEKYCYDAVGNITKRIMDPDATCGIPGDQFTSYSYDDLYRLWEESFGPQSTPHQSYTYDEVGNLTFWVTEVGGLVSYAHDDNNRLLYSAVGFPPTAEYGYVYDENGNRTKKLDASGSVLESYVYDSKNRLIELHAGGNVMRYEYDPYDQRIARETNGEKVVYYLDGEHIESIYDGRDKPKATFLRGAVIDEVVASYHYDDRGQREFYTYFHDGVTSVTALADHTGAVQQTYEYTPFGRDRASTRSMTKTTRVLVRPLLPYPEQSWALRHPTSTMRLSLIGKPQQPCTQAVPLICRRRRPTTSQSNDRPLLRAFERSRGQSQPGWRKQNSADELGVDFRQIEDP